MANKDCSKRFREKNPDKIKSYNVSWKDRNPNYQKEYRLRKGITPKRRLSHLTEEERKEYNREYSRQYQKNKSRESILLSGIRYRCKKNNIPFDLEESDIVIPEVCPILGINIVCDGSQIDSSPSVDRLVPEKGYVKGNIIIISNRANRLRNNGTSTEHFLIATFYSKLGL
jgi:hypothetical protein